MGELCYEPRKDFTEVNDAVVSEPVDNPLAQMLAQEYTAVR